MHELLLKLLREERDGTHGQSERRAVAEFVYDVVSERDSDTDPDELTEDAAGLAGSLAEAAHALATRIRAL